RRCCCDVLRGRSSLPVGHADQQRGAWLDLWRCVGSRERSLRDLFGRGRCGRGAYVAGQGHVEVEEKIEAQGGALAQNAVEFVERGAPVTLPPAARAPCLEGGVHERERVEAVEERERSLELAA